MSQKIGIAGEEMTVGGTDGFDEDWSGVMEA